MSTTKEKLKNLIIEALNLEDVKAEDINDDAPLFEEGLGLDSIDALELGIAIQKAFNVKINSKTENVKNHFSSINSLVKFIDSYQTEN